MGSRPGLGRRHLDAEDGARCEVGNTTSVRSGTRKQLFLYGGSSVAINGERVQGGAVIKVDCSVPVELANGSMEAEILLLQGRPIGEHIVQHGSFVMNSLDEIRLAYAGYRDPRFGDWNWSNDSPDHGPEKGRFASRNTTS